MECVLVGWGCVVEQFCYLRMNFCVGVIDYLVMTTKFGASIITSRESASIVARGRNYRNRVRVVDYGPGFVKARVQGTRLYSTSISWNGSSYVDVCSCPYGATCKHTVALAYVIEEDENLREILEMENVDMEEGVVLDDGSNDEDYEILNELGLIDTRKAGLEQVFGRRESRKPRQKNKLAVLKNLVAELEQEKPEEIDDKRKVYYCLYADGEDSWRDTVSLKLGLEAGRADRVGSSDKYRLGNTQHIRSMYGRKARYITEHDRKVLSIASNIYSPNYSMSHWNGVVLDELSVGAVLELLEQGGLVYWSDENEKKQKLEIDSSGVSLGFKIMESDGKLRMDAQLSGSVGGLGEKVVKVFDYQKAWVLTDKQRLVRVETGLSAVQVEQMLDLSGEFEVSSEKEKLEALRSLISVSRLVPVEFPERWLSQTESNKPGLQLVLGADLQGLGLKLEFLYGQEVFGVSDVGEYFAIVGEETVVGKRDKEAEAELMADLIERLGLDKVSEGEWLVVGEQVDELMGEKLWNLPEDWKIFWREEKKKVAVRKDVVGVSLRAKSQMDWLDVEGQVKFGQKEMELSELMQGVWDGSRLVRVGKKYQLLPEDVWRKLSAINQLSDDQGVGRVHRTQLGALVELDDWLDDVEVEQEWKLSLEYVRNFEGIKPVKPPDRLKAELRGYQKEGLAFLEYLWRLGFGGILADDMGLGKTVQTIALLARVYGKGAENKSLVVVPTSVVQNWQEEFARFCPEMKVGVFSGTGRKWSKMKNCQVVITSYALMRRDREVLAREEFEYVVLDESQYIKNYSTQTAKTARSLRAKHRLCLTGTPVENNLGELYSQFRFLNPAMLGSYEDFREKYWLPIEKKGEVAALERLRKLVKPFVLRREKDLVARDLPAKTEQTIWLEMGGKQRKLYQAVKTYYQSRVMGLVESRGAKKSQLQILEALLRLRQVCCDPGLVNFDKQRMKALGIEGLLTHESVKKREAAERVGEIVESGHSVLVFSQFVEMLKLLAVEIDKSGIEWMMLTGATKNRGDLVREFQEAEKAKVFLLSLKAAGTGLNLTAADYVIHYDPWWNPAVERQATDRTHRIGQTKPVTVQKLIVKDSIEEKIQELQQRKQALIDDIVGASSGSKSLSREDLLFLFE